MRSKVRVKICGITSVADAQYAAQCGADAIGLVFYPPSPRHLHDLSLARDIALAVGPFVNVVGLFVNPDSAQVRATLAEVSLNSLQFHGDESAMFCQQFAHPYFKALRMKPGLDIKSAADEHRLARGILLDTYVKGKPGGTGECFNWQSVPQCMRNIVLAGGLDANNVAEAIATAKPYAVDVSGGVEQSPGKKDREKIRAFIKNANVECLSD